MAYLCNETETKNEAEELMSTYRLEKYSIIELKLHFIKLS